MDWSNILFAVALVGMIALAAFSLYHGVRRNDVHLQISGWALLLIRRASSLFFAVEMAAMKRKTPASGEKKKLSGIMLPMRFRFSYRV